MPSAAMPTQEHLVHAIPSRAASLRRHQRGQAIVEFALVANLLVILLFGVMEMGLLFFQYVTMTEAARDGARAGVVHRKDGIGQMVAYARCAVVASAGDDVRDNGRGRACSPGAADRTAGWTVAVTPTSGDVSPGDPFTVDIRQTYQVNLIFAQLPVDLHTQTTMRVE